MERQSRRATREEMMMKINAIVGSAVLALAVSTAAVPAVAEGQGYGRFQAPSALEGTWQVRIAPYICATGVPLPPSAEIVSLVSFASGGTMTETTSNPRFLPGQRSIGLGYWERSGRSTYEVVFQAFVQFTGGNYTQGAQRVEQAIDMVDADHFDSTAVVAFTDLAGAPVPPSGCMRAVGVRMP
jgi:hypothetical protein